MLLCSANDISAICSIPIKNITMRPVRTCRCTRTRRSRVPFRPSVARWRCRFWAGCTINILECKFSTGTGFEPMQHAPCILEVARRDERTRRLDKVARPDEVVATEVLVAFVETPRNRETRDDSARERTRLIRADDGGAASGALSISPGHIERPAAA